MSRPRPSTYRYRAVERQLTPGLVQYFVMDGDRVVAETSSRAAAEQLAADLSNGLKEALDEHHSN